MCRIAQSVKWLTMAWAVWGSNPGGEGDIFRSRPEWSWGQPKILYKGSSQGVQRAGRGANHPPPSSDEVKERADLCLYSLRGLF